MFDLSLLSWHTAAVPAGRWQGGGAGLFARATEAMENGCHLLLYGNCAQGDSLPQQQLLCWLLSGAAGGALWSSMEKFPDLVFIPK